MPHSLTMVRSGFSHSDSVLSYRNESEKPHLGGRLSHSDMMHTVVKSETCRYLLWLRLLRPVVHSGRNRSLEEDNVPQSREVLTVVDWVVISLL